MDIRQTPFSHFGSYMSIKYEESQQGLTLKSLRGKSRAYSDILKFVIYKNQSPVPYQMETDYNKLTLNFDGGQIEMCFDSDSRILIRGYGQQITLNLDTIPLYNFEYNFLLTNKNHEYCVINSYKNLTKFLVYTSVGTVSLNQNLNYDTTGSASEGDNSSIILIKPNENNEFMAIIQDVPTHMSLPLDKEFNFEACYQASKQEFDNFVNKQFPINDMYREKLKLAAYITWSSIVRPEGYLKRPTMWASNNNFLGAWSWDHCFNALALAGIDDQLAYDQMAVLFDYQDEYGQLPGSVSDSTLRWNFAKPPVHGLFFSKMMKRMTFTENQLIEVYTWIKKQVSFYLTFKDSNGDGIAEYHHGNDSGQDNSTVFQHASLVDSPDLTAFLIKAMDLLTEISEKLNWAEQKIRWEKKADDLTKQFIEHFIVNNRPIARLTLNGDIIDTQALLPFVSLILGMRLPKDVRDEMIQIITSSQYLTPYGIATEAIDSPLYQDDAYWRGAIWAPSTLLIIEALEDCDEKEIAIEISKRFCNTMNNQPLAENFNALTGEALRDKSFSWTASTFLYLTSKLFNYENQ